MDQHTSSARYCSVGEHFVENGFTSICALCGATFCAYHQGDQQRTVFVGDYFGCPDHAQEVAQINEDQWEVRRTRFQNRP